MALQDELLERQDDMPSGGQLVPIRRRASVIVDVASLTCAIEGALPATRRFDLSIRRLIEALGRRGIDVSRASLGLAVQAVRTGPDSNEQIAQANTGNNRRWFERQRARCGVAVTLLPGGHDGIREIGVDDVVVAGAIIEAHRIAHDPLCNGEEVLVVTHDGDMDHLAAYAAPTPLTLVGRFTEAAASRMTDSGVRYELLTLEELKQCDGTYVSPIDAARQIDDLPQPAVPGHAAATVEPLSTMTTFAVVDAYGVACSAACVLGVARLPNSASLRQLLADYCNDPHIALLVSVPDIELRPGRCFNRLERDRRSAWLDRDRRLDALAAELTDDGDDSTQARRGVLRPDRVPLHLRERLDRAGPIRSAKRLSTQLTADIVRIGLERPDATVMVLSDSPHIAWVTHVLATDLGRTTWLRRSVVAKVVRLGVYAAPAVIVDSTGSDRRPGGEFVMLTESRLARAVGLSTQLGRERRLKIMDAVANATGHTTWRVVGYDAEVDGIRVRNLGDDHFEMVVADALSLGLSNGQKWTPDDTQLGLQIEPALPTAGPFPAPTGTHWGQQLGRLSDVVIVDREGEIAYIDIDGDGCSDFGVSIGNEARPFRLGAPAVVGCYGRDDDWALVAIDDATPEPIPCRVHVIEVRAGNPMAKACDDLASHPAVVVYPPGSPPIPFAVGDVFWAMPLATTADDPCWMALSTPGAAQLLASVPLQSAERLLL